MLFVQVDTKEKEHVFLVRDERCDETVAMLLEQLETRNIDPRNGGIKVGVTEAQEYLSYWNNDYCYYAGAEERCSTIEAVAAKRDPDFTICGFETAVELISAL